MPVNLSASSPYFVAPVRVAQLFTVVEPLLEVLVTDNTAFGSPNVTFTALLRHQNTSGIEALQLTFTALVAGLCIDRIALLLDAVQASSCSAPPSPSLSRGNPCWI